MAAGRITLSCLAFLLLFGIVLMTWGIWDLNLAKSAREWPSVQGEVIKLGFSSRIGPRGATVYILDIEYQYRVEEALFKSDQIKYGNRFDNSVKLALGHQYEEGDSIRVFYDPRKPSRSVLVVKEHILDYMISAIGTAIVLFVLALCIRERQRLMGMIR